MLLPIFIIFVFSFVAWVLTSIMMRLIRQFTLLKRIVIQYIGVLLIFGGVFYGYYWGFSAQLGVIQSMWVSWLSLLFFELLSWKWYYKKIPWYYGYVHWWFPSYLVGVGIYWAYWMLV